MRAWLLLVMATATAHAEPKRFAPPVIVEPSATPYDGGGAVKTIFLNRCASGCTITAGGTNDAANNETTILTPPGTFHLDPFMFGDDTWNQVLQCVKDVYSPYDVTITDQMPTSGVFNETMVAGTSAQGGEPQGTLGIAPLAGDCSPLADQISFAFANSHDPATVVDNLCWTVAQETAHIYGLDHEFEFTDPSAPTPQLQDGTRSACNDPMTYQTDCGGEKFFRDVGARCGEFALRTSCKCSPTQNSHFKMKTLFGSATPTTTPPVVTILFPAAGATIDKGAPVGANATAQRGVKRVELWVNGALWDSVRGADFGGDGQESNSYDIVIPNDVPDGVMDLVIRAYDDLGIFTDSAPVTVTKGAPCTDASQCAQFQSCDPTGRCVFPAATGALGDACDYGAFCTSMDCQADLSGQKVCVQDCQTDDNTTCPGGFECYGTGSNGETQGLCIVHDTGGGCCSVGGNGAPAVLLGAIVGLILRRRRS